MSSTRESTKPTSSKTRRAATTRRRLVASPRAVFRGARSLSESDLDRSRRATWEPWESFSLRTNLEPLLAVAAYVSEPEVPTARLGYHFSSIRRGNHFDRIAISFYVHAAFGVGIC